MIVSLKKFTEVVKACNGNLSKVADELDVSRSTVNNWVRENKEYSDVVKDA